MPKFKTLQKPVNIGTAENPKWGFCMSTEVVNWYGFRVLTEGIDWSAFELNPVSYFNHNFDDKYKEKDRYPIAKWSNLRKEDGKLYGDLEPDMKDPEGKILNDKIADGFINACSIYFRWIEWSEDSSLMLKGQTGPTLTKALLLECSPVGLPANQQAIRLQLETGETIALNAETKQSELNDLFKKFSPQQTQKIDMKKELITAALGLADSATDQEVLSAIEKLKAVNTSAESMLALQAELNSLKEARVSSLVKNAKDAGKISDEEMPVYTKLAIADFESTEMALGAKVANSAAAAAPASIIGALAATGGNGAAPANGAPATKSSECRFITMPTSQLSALQLEKPSEFAALQNEYLTLLKDGK